LKKEGPKQTRTKKKGQMPEKRRLRVLSRNNQSQILQVGEEKDIQKTRLQEKNGKKKSDAGGNSHKSGDYKEAVIQNNSCGVRGKGPDSCRGEKNLGGGMKKKKKEKCNNRAAPAPLKRRDRKRENPKEKKRRQERRTRFTGGRNGGKQYKAYTPKMEPFDGGECFGKWRGKTQPSTKVSRTGKKPFYKSQKRKWGKTTRRVFWGGGVLPRGQRARPGSQARVNWEKNRRKRQVRVIPRRQRKKEKTSQVGTQGGFLWRKGENPCGG